MPLHFYFWFFFFIFPKYILSWIYLIAPPKFPPYISQSFQGNIPDPSRYTPGLKQKFFQRVIIRNFLNLLQTIQEILPGSHPKNNFTNRTGILSKIPWTVILDISSKVPPGNHPRTQELRRIPRKIFQTIFSEILYKYPGAMIERIHWKNSSRLY